MDLSKKRLQSKLEKAGESVAVKNNSKYTHDTNKKIKACTKEEEADRGRRPKRN